MGTVNPAVPARAAHRAVLVVTVGLAATLAWFVAQKLHYLDDISQASYTDYFWPRRAGLLAHLCGGLVASVCGLIQIWLGLTHRVGRLHRTLGKAYAAGVLVGSIGGFYLSITITGQLAYSAGLFMLDVAWLTTTGMALYAIHLRQIEQHRDWMLRAYTVTFAFVTFRLLDPWLHRWFRVPEAASADDLDKIMAWACWAVPLLVAEVLIQLRALNRRRRTA